jgi:hypothetical protein
MAAITSLALEVEWNPTSVFISDCLIYKFRKAFMSSCSGILLMKRPASS